MNNRTLGLLLAVVAFFILIVVAYSFSGANISAPEVPLRFLVVLIGALGMGAAYYLTRTSEVWAVGMRQVINGVAGAMLYAVLLWLFSGTLFELPAVGDLTLRPAVVIPVLFGYLLGPMVGFLAGGFGDVIGDILAGLPPSPEWGMGSALIGFVSGLHLIFSDRKRALDIVSGIAVLLAILATLGHVINPTTANQFGEGPITAWLGYSALAGVALCMAIRFAFPDQAWGEVVMWGALGSLIGPGFAAIGDLWIKAGLLTRAEATIGQFIPTAGPNLVAIAFLTPFLFAALEFLQQPETA